jgi:cystathionine gamma-lyase
MKLLKLKCVDFGGMISIVLKNKAVENTFKIASSFEVITLAESLGVE